MPKRYRKSIPKGIQNDAKTEANIYYFSRYFNKGENARNYCIYNRKRGSRHLTIHAKSIQNRCQKKACNKYGQLCQNGPQMDAQIVRKIENMGKYPLKMGAKNKHDFWKSPGRDFLSPGSPKMNTNQQDNLQKNNKKQTTYSR